MAIFECAKCRDTCSVRFDDDVTAFCCGCAHDEIARLKAEVERHLRCTSSYPEKQAACARKDAEIARLKRALAAGPAALREIADAHTVNMTDYLAKIYREAAVDVERAQAAAMKEGDHG